MLSVTLTGALGHDVPVTLHGGIAFSLASHYATVVNSVFDEATSVQFSFADTISAGGHGFTAELGATVYSGAMQAAEGNATLIGSGSAADLSSLFDKTAAASSLLGVDTIFGGIASHLTASDLGSAAATVITAFSRPGSDSVSGTVQSVTGGSSFSLGNNATITIIDAHHIAANIVKLG